MGERYQQAADYIDQHIKSGVSDHAIREHFLQHGWTPHDVAQAFTLYSQSARHPTKLLYPKKKLTFFGVLRDISSAIFYNFPAYLTSIILLTVALIGYWSFMALFINEDASEWLIIIFAAFILAGFHSFQSIIFAIMSSLIKARYEKKKALEHYHLWHPANCNWYSFSRSNERINRWLLGSDSTGFCVDIMDYNYWYKILP
jgi:hypothetical protein